MNVGEASQAQYFTHSRARSTAWRQVVHRLDHPGRASGRAASLIEELPGRSWSRVTTAGHLRQICPPCSRYHRQLERTEHRGRMPTTGCAPLVSRAASLHTASSKWTHSSCSQRAANRKTLVGSRPRRSASMSVATTGWFRYATCGVELLPPMRPNIRAPSIDGCALGQSSREASITGQSVVRRAHRGVREVREFAPRTAR